MSLKNKFALALNSIINKTGTQIRVRYFTQTVGSVWDDDTSLVQSGNDLWTSGVFLPLSNQVGGADRMLVEQGRIQYDDTKLFMHGSLLLISGNIQLKIHIGSPISPSKEYSVIPPGPIGYSVQDTPIYKFAYIRRIGGVGSLLGE